MLKYTNIKQLGQTYNTLTLVNTKGDDTIYMAECLKSLKELYSIFSEEYSLQQEEKNKEQELNAEETGE